MSDWRPKPTARELLRQANELELLTEWQKAGIDVESLYVPPKATESPRNGMEGPAKGID